MPRAPVLLLSPIVLLLSVSPVDAQSRRDRASTETLSRSLADAKEHAAELERRNRDACVARTRAADEAVARAADARAKATAMLDSLSGSLADLKAGLKA